MADKKIKVQVDIKPPDIQPTIAELKKLKLQLKETSDPAQFKQLQQQINDTEDAIRAARVGADNFAEVLGTLPGPIGQIGNQIGGTLQSLKQFGSLKFKDLKASFVDLGKDLVDAAKGIGNLTGITKVYTTLNNGLASSFVKIGIGEQAAAAGARAFSAALTATGVGAIVVALGFLVNKIIEVGTEYFNQAETISKANEKIQSSFEYFDKVRETDLQRTLANIKKFAKDERDEAEQTYNAKVNFYQDELKQLKQQGEFNIQFKKAEREALNQGLSITKDEEKALNEKYDKLETERLLRIQSIQVKQIENENEISDRRKQFRKDDAAAADKNEQERIRKAKELADTLSKINKSEREAAISLLDERDQERRKIVNDYNERIQLASKFGQDTVILEEAKLNALKQLNDKFAKEDKDNEQKSYDEKIDLLNKEYAFKLDMAAKIKSLEDQTAQQTFENNRIVAQSWVDLGNNISSVFGSLINVFENGSNAAKAFGVLQVAVNAASSIGQILLNSQAGQFEYNKAIATGNAAILSAIPKLVNPVTAPLGIAEAAAGKAAIVGATAGKAALKTATALQIGTVGVTSAAQIAAILSAKKSSTSTTGGSSAGGGASITTPSVSSISVPQLNTSGGQNPTEQIAETLSTAQKPLKAYVVSGEISSQMALDRRTNRAATFG